MNRWLLISTIVFIIIITPINAIYFTNNVSSGTNSIGYWIGFTIGDILISWGFIVYLPYRISKWVFDRKKHLKDLGIDTTN